MSKLVGGLCCLGSISSRQGRHVGESLDRGSSILEPDTGNREGTDGGGHLSEVVDGLIRIAVQLIQCSINLVQSSTILTGVGQNGLDSVDLGLILFETVNRRLNEALEHRFTSTQGRGTDSAKGCDTNSLHDGHIGGRVNGGSS